MKFSPDDVSNLVQQYRMLRSILPAALVTGCLAAATMPPETEQRPALEIYKQMVETKSGFTTGATTPVVDAVATRLKASLS